MADFDLIVIGSGPRRLRIGHSRQPAWHEDSHRGARRLLAAFA